LFNRTIEENIACGFSGEIADVVEAARKANIHNFIQSLPSGYKPIAGKGELQLSGGEKQRVAIARALIRNPSILILDEATSALDAESEKLVQDALDGARNGRTVITIAHRISTIQDSDEIFVMDHQGRIIERGDHSTLLRRLDLNYKIVDNINEKHLINKKSSTIIITVLVNGKINSFGSFSDYYTIPVHDTIDTIITLLFLKKIFY